MSIRKSMFASALAATLCLAGACAHNNSSTETASNGQVSGEIRPDNPSTSAVPGPAVQDASGKVYVSSATGGGRNTAGGGAATHRNAPPPPAPGAAARGAGNA